MFSVSFNLDNADMDANLTRTREFFYRTFSIIILYPILIWSLIIGQWTTLALACIVGALSLVEWFRMTIKAETLPKTVTFLLIGNAYIFIGCFLLWFLSTKLNWMMLTIILTLIFCSDVGGYIFGNLLKGPKLFPRISPKKTWSGALGAICFTVAGGYILSMTPYYDPKFLAFIPAPLFFVLISVVAQAGDLLESWCKRQLNVKDSSQLIPGHGGVLDRVDSVLAVVYMVSVLMWISSAYAS
jgi:phosphatidate cytidylyltransferase